MLILLVTNVTIFHVFFMDFCTVMETLKRTIFSNWHFMRWLRLAIGLFIAFQAYELQNGLLVLMAGLFLFQAIGNAGCCGTSGCVVEPKKSRFQKAEDVEFEEIK